LPSSPLAKLQVEKDKGLDNKLCDQGVLLYPTAYGYPESRGKDYQEQEQIRQHEQEVMKLSQRGGIGE